MEQTLIELGKQVPSLAVLVVVVWIFVINQAKQNAENREMHRDLQRESLEARNQMRTTIVENSVAAKENTIAMTKLTTVVEHLAKTKI